MTDFLKIEEAGENTEIEGPVVGRGRGSSTRSPGQGLGVETRDTNEERSMLG